MGRRPERGSTVGNGKGIAGAAVATDPARSKGATQSRAATEQALEQAALELLEQEGVLAGLNLREVAERASVNRGLVYHYFGSRQRLLRAALGRRSEAFQEDIEEIWVLPFHERGEMYLTMALKHQSAITLKTILMLDRDERVRMLPLWPRSRETHLRDIAVGNLPPDTDLEAMQAALVSLVTGYILQREAFAAELGLDLDELDSKVAAMFSRVLDGMAGRPKDADPSP